MSRLPHRNKLERVSKSSLEGLFKLEKLKLSDNRIQALEEGAFDHLLSLARLEVGDNPLVCNCSLAWLFSWLDSQRSSSVLADDAKCALPFDLADVSIRKLDEASLGCGGHRPTSKRPASTDRQVRITPSAPHQIAFVGDSLKMSCKAQAEKVMSNDKKSTNPVSVQTQG